MNKQLPVPFLFWCALMPSLHAQITYDVEALDAGPLSYVTPGTYPVQVTVRNNNIDYYVPVLTASWQLDGGDVHSCPINQFLIYGYYLYPTFSDRFTHTDSVSLTTIGTHSFKAWTSMPGNQPDPNPSNDTVSITIHVVDSLPEKKMVVYYGTHTQCFPCGTYGEPQLEGILDSFPNSAYVITAHDGLADPFNTEDGGDINDTYFWPFTGHPAFVYDQFKFPFFFSIVPYTFGAEWLGGRWRLDYRTPVQVKLEKVIMDSVTRKISGEVHTRFFADYSADLTVNVAIVEDSVWGEQDGVPGGYIYHRYVLRDMTDGIAGVEGIIPPSASAGDEFIYEFQDSVGADVNVKNIYIVGYVQENDADPLKREIVNTDEVRVADFAVATATENNGVHEISIHVFPNPAKDHFFIVADMQIEDGQFELTDILGETILKGNLESRNEKVTLHDLPPGLYFLQVESLTFPKKRVKVVVTE